MIFPDISVQYTTHPYPGLRPFNVDENHLFFGREGQENEMMDILRKRRFLAVTGSSGSGKSSLVRCGLQSSLHNGFLDPEISELKVAIFRPGHDPIGNLVTELNRILPETPASSGSPTWDESIRRKATEAHCRANTYGLVNTFRWAYPDPDSALVVIIDQFEELFRFQTGRPSEDAAHFVKLILKAVDQPDSGIYVIITMRSDHIGSCTRFRGLPEKINRGQYLVPQLSREQLKAAIANPARVAGSKISPRLLHRILQDTGPQPDQLPVMQHALMRTWQCWKNDHQEGERVSVRHYEAIGTIQSALNRHAEEVYAELQHPGETALAKKLFKALTFREPGALGVRRPTSAGVLCELCGCSMAELEAVSKGFRKPDCAFLLPGTDTKLEADTVLDISHESLMRVWQRLAKWAEEEGESAIFYRRIADSAVRFYEGQGSLLVDPELGLALAWRKKQQPNADWAGRYHPEFESATKFLNKSAAQAKIEMVEKERIRRAKLLRARGYAIVITVLLLVSTGLLGVLWKIYKEAKEKTIQAEKARIEEEKQKIRAEEAVARGDSITKVAQYNECLALEQTEKAEQNAENAKLSEEKAKESAESEKQQRLIAEDKTREANKNKEEANRNKNEADRRTEEAVASKIKATREKQISDSLRLLSAAETIALKSQSVNDLRLKCALALLAFKYHDRYNPEGVMKPTIYYALYQANEALFASQSHSNAKFNHLPKHSNAIRNIVTVAAPGVLTAGTDGQLVKWDLSKGTAKIDATYLSPASIRAIAVSQDATVAIFPDPKQTGFIKVINLNSSSQKLTSLPGPEEHILSLAFLPGGQQFVSGSSEGYLRLWDFRMGQTESPMALHSPVLSIAANPDRSQFALSLGNGAVLRLDPSRDWARDTLVKPGSNPANELLFSPDGKYLALACRNGDLIIQDLSEKGKAIKLNNNSSAELNDISFSPDGRFVMTAGNDRTATVWDLENTFVPALILKHENQVTSAQFSPDGQSVWTGDKKGNLIHRPLSLRVLAENLCAKAQPIPTLNIAEWEHWIGKEIPFESICQ